jgi:hypothetical protein
MSGLKPGPILRDKGEMRGFFAPLRMTNVGGTAMTNVGGMAMTNVGGTAMTNVGGMAMTTVVGRAVGVC